MKYQETFKTIWANFDPNLHMRHSAYLDYTAEVRARFFMQYNLTMDEFIKLHIGPILFKEEITYFKEIKMGQDITVTMELTAASDKLERWEFTHQMFNNNGELAAQVIAKGAWIDIQKRKLTVLPENILKKLLTIPKSSDFIRINLKN